MEEIIYLVQTKVPMLAATRLGNSYHNNYNQPAVGPPQPPPPESAKQSSKQTAEKAKEKESRNKQPLGKDKVNGQSQPFCFDVLAQLANIPARITLYELLKLSRNTLEALREALADAKVFAMHMEVI